MTDKELLINKACYMIDLVEDTLIKVEADKPAGDLPMYNFKLDYKPEEDTHAIVSKAFGKPRFLELAFNTLEKLYKLEDLMENEKFKMYAGSGRDWFQYNNYDYMFMDLMGTFVNLYSIAKAEMHTSRRTK